MTDIGTALEKLIDVLQLEGHELFRIFTEVQGINAICNGVIVMFGFLGLILGAELGYRFVKSDDKLSDDDIFCILVIALVGLVISLILSGVGVHIYMHLHYPEYFAAKELIYHIGSLTS